jgi:hypothetical protein
MHPMPNILVKECLRYEANCLYSLKLNLMHKTPKIHKKDKYLKLKMLETIFILVLESLFQFLEIYYQYKNLVWIDTLENLVPRSGSWPGFPFFIPQSTKGWPRSASALWRTFSFQTVSRNLESWLWLPNISLDKEC